MQYSCGNIFPLSFLLADLVNAQSGEVGSLKNPV